MKYQKALALAAELHKDQVRKGSNIPYITHLMTVSAFVFEFGGSEDQAIAGLLHDAIEDQSDKISLEAISNDFGQEVARIVAACTDSVLEPKPPWKERKTAYLENLGKKDNMIKLVVACDKYHNAQCINRDVQFYGENVWRRFTASKEDIVWYYTELLNQLSMNFDNNVLKLFSAEVSTMHSLVHGK